MRFIPTALHGALDYLYAVAFLVLPLLAAETPRTRGLLLALAGVTVAYALLTRYELGALRRLPMRTHLAVDVAIGILLLGYAFFSPEETESLRWLLGLLGAGAVFVGLTTKTVSPVEEARTANV
jgi:hypothetical protein